MATVSGNTSDRATHVVLNQPPALLDYNAFDADVALTEALEREGGAWGLHRAQEFGAITGSAVADEHCRRALAR
jgi:putative acyl-CoA dehydrogenase